MSWLVHVLVFELEFVLLTGGRALLLLVCVCAYIGGGGCLCESFGLADDGKEGGGEGWKEGARGKRDGGGETERDTYKFCLVCAFIRGAGTGLSRTHSLPVCVSVCVWCRWMGG